MYTWYLVVWPSFLITAIQRLYREITRIWHLFNARLTTDLSSLLFLDLYFQTGFCISAQKFSKELRLRYWAGKSIISIQLNRYHSVANLLVCLGSLSRWNMHFSGMPSSGNGSIIFCSIFAYACWSMVSSILRIWPAPLYKKYPHTIILDPSCFEVYVVNPGSGNRPYIRGTSHILPRPFTFMKNYFRPASTKCVPPFSCWPGQMFLGKFRTLCYVIFL